MSLPKVTVVGFGEPIELRLTGNATKKEIKELLKLHSEHEGCGGRLSMNACCKECGEVRPPTVYVTEDGKLLSKGEAEGGVFEVAGKVNTSEVDWKWVETTYLAEVTDDAIATGSVIEALGDTALVGYVRLRKNSDERPAALVVLESGVLALRLLYYADTEATRGITLYEDSDSGMVEKLISSLETVEPTNMGSMTNRELRSLQDYLTKPQEATRWT